MLRAILGELMKKLFVSTVAAFVLFGNIAYAEPPPGTDPDSPLAAFARSIRHKDTNYSCCNEADCRPTDVELRSDGQYWAWIGKENYGPNAPDKWVPVPWSIIDNTKANGSPPDGANWVCYYNQEVHCAIIEIKS